MTPYPKTFAERLREFIRREEGCKLMAYPDPEGQSERWSIGWGHQIHDEGMLEAIACHLAAALMPLPAISQAEADSLLDQDIQVAENAAQRIFGAWVDMHSDRGIALTAMLYQMGPQVGYWRNMMAAIIRQDWVGVAYWALHNKKGGMALWFQQTPDRATRTAAILKTNDLEKQV